MFSSTFSYSFIHYSHSAAAINRLNLPTSQINFTRAPRTELKKLKYPCLHLPEQASIMSPLALSVHSVSSHQRPEVDYPFVRSAYVQMQEGRKWFGLPWPVHPEQQ